MCRLSGPDTCRVLPPIMKSNLEKFQITFLKVGTHLEQQKLNHTESLVCLRVGYMLQAVDTHFHCRTGRDTVI